VKIEYILVIVVCAALGYWCVGRFIDFLKAQAREAGNKEQTKQEGSRDGQKANPSDECAWFQILGTTPSATVDEIKSAYRTKARQYHPDRVADLGIELQNIADRKMKELNAAYEEGLRVRGTA